MTRCSCSTYTHVDVKSSYQVLARLACQIRVLDLRLCDVLSNVKRLTSCNVECAQRYLCCIASPRVSGAPRYVLALSIFSSKDSLVLMFMCRDFFSCIQTSILHYHTSELMLNVAGKNAVLVRFVSSDAALAGEQAKNLYYWCSYARLLSANVRKLWSKRLKD